MSMDQGWRCAIRRLRGNKQPGNFKRGVDSVGNLIEERSIYYMYAKEVSVERHGRHFHYEVNMGEVEKKKLKCEITSSSAWTRSRQVPDRSRIAIARPLKMFCIRDVSLEQFHELFHDLLECLGCMITSR